MAVVGLALVAASAGDRRDGETAGEDGSAAALERPRASDPSRGVAGDHWHVAYGVYVCDRFLPPISSDEDPLGIHTHDDGLIHVHPFDESVAGERATLSVFTNTVGMGLSPAALELPDGETYRDGDACGSQPGKVRVLRNGEEVGGDPGDLRLRDGDVVVIAFAPAGAAIPSQPPSVAELANPSDVRG